MSSSRAVALVILGSMLPASLLHAEPMKPPARAAASASAASASAPLPATPSAQPSAPTPDIVRFKKGGFVRGTVLENDPRGSVVVETDKGKRTFASADVSFAGRREDDPGEVKGAATEPKAPEAKLPGPPAKGTSPSKAVAPAIEGRMVSLRSDKAGLRFYLLKDSSFGTVSTNTGSGSFQSDRFEPLCAAPCETRLASGTYRMALGMDDDRPSVVPGDVQVKEGSVLRGNYASYRAVRITGLVLALVGATAGSVGLFRIGKADGERTTLQTGLMIGGGVALGGGVAMMFVSDDATIGDPPPEGGGTYLRREGVSPIGLHRRPSRLVFSGVF